METELVVRNGASFEVKLVPVLNEDLFRRKILEACSENARLINFFGYHRENKKIQIFAMLGRDQDGEIAIFSMEVFGSHPSFHSLTPQLPSAHMFEREIAEQFTITPKGHPWAKPVRCHPEQGYPFYRVDGEEAHEVAVGPIHAGIIEPGHFRFSCHGEEILNLEIQLGYQHRGIEKMMEEFSRIGLFF